VTALLEGLAYQNTDPDQPTAGRRLFHLKGLQNARGSAEDTAGATTLLISSSIDVAPWQGAPIVGRVDALTLLDSVEPDRFGTSQGRQQGHGQAGAALHYGLENAVSTKTRIEGVRYHLSNACRDGTFYLNRKTGHYCFQPNSDGSLQRISGDCGEHFRLSVSDGRRSTTAILLLPSNGNHGAAWQIGLVHVGGPKLTAAAQMACQQAFHNVNLQLNKLLTSSDRGSIFHDVFERAWSNTVTFEANLQALVDTIAGPGLQITVDLRSDAELNVAAAAYAATGHRGTERIYLNGDKINSGELNVALLTSVLLEECGHAIDQKLNYGADSPGDEGQLFAVQVIGYPFRGRDCS
jgi:hypothetical protein